MLKLSGLILLATNSFQASVHSCMSFDVSALTQYMPRYIQKDLGKLHYQVNACLHNAAEAYQTVRTDCTKKQKAVAAQASARVAG